MLNSLLDIHRQIISSKIMQGIIDSGIFVRTACNTINSSTLHDTFRIETDQSSSSIELVAHAKDNAYSATLSVRFSADVIQDLLENDQYSEYIRTLTSKYPTVKTDTYDDTFWHEYQAYVSLIAKSTDLQTLSKFIADYVQWSLVYAVKLELTDAEFTYYRDLLKGPTIA